MMTKKFYLLLIFTAILAFTGIGSWGLTESSEARYAEIAMEMYDNQEWVTPTLMGIKHFHKPPITYQLTKIAYSIFGVNEFGARFFLQIALLLQLILVFKLTDALFKDKKVSLWAAMIYLTFPLVLVSVRNLTTDAYLNTFILAAVYFWVQWQESKSAIKLYLYYLFLGLVFLTKGPVGWIIPIGFAGIYLWQNKLGIYKGIHQFLGLLFMLAISASWYILVAIDNPELLDYFINHQLVDRVASNNFSRSKPFWYYFAFAPLLGLPWLILFIIQSKTAVKMLWKDSKYFKSLLAIGAVFFSVLTLSKSKLPLYILPLYPFLAIGIAYTYSKLKSSFKTVHFIFGVVLSIAVIIAVFLPQLIELPFYTGTIIGITGLALLSVIFKFDQGDEKEKTMKIGLVNTGLLLTIFILVFSANESKLNSPKPMAKYILKEFPSAEVIVFNDLLPSLKFYLRKDIVTVNNGKYTTKREVQFESNSSYTEYLINYESEEERLNQLMENEQTVFIIKQKDKRNAIFEGRYSHREEFGKFYLYHN